MLNDEQKTWVTGKMYELLEKYEPLMPLTDEQWEQLTLDTKEICEKTKNNADVRRVFVVILDYFRDKDKLAKELGI